MYNEAIAEFKKAIPLTEASEWSLSKAGLGHVYAVSGKKSEARTLLDELKQLSEQEYVSAASIAFIYAGLGEKDQAFAWLDKGYEQRAFQMQWIKLEPRWDSSTLRPAFRGLDGAHGSSSLTRLALRLCGKLEATRTSSPEPNGRKTRSQATEFEVLA